MCKFIISFELMIYFRLLDTYLNYTYFMGDKSFLCKILR